MSANRTARVHLLGSMIFDKNRMNPNTVMLNPRIFKEKGKAAKAPNVTMRFFQFISEGAKIGLSFSLSARRPATIRLTKEKIPSNNADRKGRRPEPGLEKLPRDAAMEEIMIAPEKKRKITLLFWSFLSFMRDPIQGNGSYPRFRLEFPRLPFAPIYLFPFGRRGHFPHHSLWPDMIQRFMAYQKILLVNAFLQNFLFRKKREAI